jgi:hypothetical protein
VFEPQTKDKAAGGKPRVLLLDGHSSHYTLDVVQFARAHNITLLAYPPHCTHALQGLDVACFAKMKSAWKEEINTFEDKNRKKVGKGDFTGVFGRAYTKAFTSETVDAAFRATGIHPFNPNVISEVQLKPSLPHSVKGSFPLPQISPVRCIMAAFRAQATTTTEGESNTPIAGPSGDVPSTQSTPSRRRAHPIDSNIDPDLFTPSKRIKLMNQAIGNTSSGSFLVSSAPMKSLESIPQPVLEAPPALKEPDWELAEIAHLKSGYVSRNTLEERVEKLTENLKLAHQHIISRDLMLEGTSAQLVFQNLLLAKLNETLHIKENKKKDDRTILFEGKAVALTADEFEAKLRMMAQKRAADAAEKEQRAATRATKKDARTALESRWEEMKKAHALEIQAWGSECAKQMAEGVPKRYLPKKPIRPKKPLLPRTSAAPSNEADEEVGEEAENETEESQDGD